MRAAAVVLAAGASERMGGPNKLLMDFEGRPLLARTLDAVAPAPFDEVVVVTGRDADAVRALAQAAGARAVHNAAFRDGLGGSIAVGVGSLRGWDVVAVVLGDLPLLQTHTVGAALEAADPERIVRPVVEGRPGHPVVFGRRFAPDLRALRGDDGARPILRRYAGHVTLLPCDDAGAVSDADTPATLRALRYRGRFKQEGQEHEVPSQKIYGRRPKPSTAPMTASSDRSATTTERIAVRVLLFSVLREKVGRHTLEVDLASPATGRTLLDCLAERHPIFTAYRSTLRLAVGQIYRTEDVALRDGDEVALITPVSGG